MKKRVFSVLMALTLVLGLFPILTPHVHAEEEPATITGMTVTVDGVEYTGSTEENPVVITPGTESIVYTVTGTNLQNGSEANRVQCANDYELSIRADSSDWAFNEDGTTATCHFDDSWYENCTNFEILYTNDGWETTQHSGIILSYDDSDFVEVNLKLKAEGAEGNPVAGKLDAWLLPDGVYVGTDECGYSSVSCFIGENTLTYWDFCPEGYALPTEDITFNVDEDSEIIITSENATVEAGEDDVYYIVVKLKKEEYREVNLKLKAVDTEGNVIDGDLDAQLSHNDEWVGTDECGYSSVSCFVGENVLTDWDLCPDGYALPTEDITFNVDKDGNITITGGNAEVEIGEDGVYYIVVTLEADTSGGGDGEDGEPTTYTVTIDDSIENGTVTFADGFTSSAESGTWFYLDITPDEGYVLNNVIITRENGDTVSFNYKYYSFLMPDENVTVTATFLLADSGSTVTYPLWVGGEQFTSEKFTIRDSTGGTATYDRESNTLTLDDYGYEGNGYEGKAILYGGAKSSMLNIDLVGASYITLTNNSGQGLDAYGSVTFSGSGSLDIIGGHYGVNVMGALIVNGGSITANGTNINGYGVNVMDDLTINSGSLTATGGSYGVNTMGSITVNGGSLTAAGSSRGVSILPTNTFTVGSNLKVYDANGQVIEAPDYVKLTYVRISAPVVASVTMNGETTNCATFDEAIEAVSEAVEEDDAVVKLLDNIELSSRMRIESGVFTLDLNGFTISSPAGALFVDGGTVILTDTSENKTGIINGGAGVGVEVEGGTVTIRGGKITADSGQGGAGFYAVLVGFDGTLNIEGGIIVCDDVGVFTYGGAVTITGGTITGNNIDVHDFYRKNVITLSLAEGAKTGATFPGGIEIGGTTLQKALTDGAACWQGDKQITLTEDQRIINDGDVVIRAACTHSGNTNTDDGDCTTEITCSECGTVITPAKENHTPEVDDGDCTTAVKCIECEKDAIPATGGHVDGDDNNHDCDNCTVTNVDGGHHGGTATCMAFAVCAECGQSYGEKNTSNHTKQNTTVKDAVSETCGKDGYTGDTYCECGAKIASGETIPATGEHVDGDDDDHDCDSCPATNVDGGHHGGTATCMAFAICAECGEAYGEKDTSNHTEQNTTVKDAVSATCGTAGYTGDTYCECGAKIASGETIPADGHNYAEVWECDDDMHWHECFCGDKTDIASHDYSDEVCDVCGYTMTSHTHSWSYAASGATITATCANADGECPNAVQSITLAAPESSVYDGTAKEATASGTIEGETAPAITYTGDALTNGKPINAGSYEASITVGDVTVSVTFVIKKAPLTASGDVTATGTYGQKLSELALSATKVTSNGAEVPGTWTLTGDSIPSVGDTGNYTATFTPDAGGANYETLTKTVSLTIAQDDAPTMTATTTMVRNQPDCTVRLDLTTATGYPTTPGGAPAFTVQTGTTYSGLTSAAIDGNILVLVADNTNSSTNDTVTVNVTDMGNYRDGTITVRVNYTGKTPVTITGVAAQDGTYNGRAQQGYTGTPSSAYTGTYEITYTGRGNDYNSTTAPTNAGDYTVTFKVPDSNQTYIGSTSLDFSIGKATGTGSVTMAGWTYGGAASDPVPTSTTNSTDSVTYLYKVKGADDSTYTATKPTNAGTYTVKATFVATANYTEAASTADFTITGMVQTAPSAPELDSKTYNSVTLKAIDANVNGAAVEYSKDGGATWQSSPSFTGLSASTKYSFVARHAAVGNYAPSTASAVTEITTNAVSSSGGGRGYVSTYKPSIEETTGGNTTVSNKNPEKGDKVTITTDPDKGYEVEVVIVTDRNGNKVEVTDNGDGTYSFVQPAGKVTITVTYKNETCNGGVDCPTNSFTDLDADAWYHKAIDFVMENDMMSGYPGNLFGPNDSITRGQIVTILHRLEDTPVVNYLMTYKDVDQEKYYAEAIRWATSEGIVAGYGNDSFGPDDPITRQQLATILWRYSQHKGYDVSVGENTNILSFEDAFDISEYAIPAMQWACGAGVMGGYGNGYLGPNDGATRAQAAQMLKNFMEKAAK